MKKRVLTAYVGLENCLKQQYSWKDRIAKIYDFRTDPQQKKIELKNHLLNMNQKTDIDWAKFVDIPKNYLISTLMKTFTLENFLNIARQTLTGMNFIPINCLQTIFCETQRKWQSRNIESLGDVLTNLFWAPVVMGTEQIVGTTYTAIAETIKRHWSIWHDYRWVCVKRLQNNEYFSIL